MEWTVAGRTVEVDPAHLSILFLTLLVGGILLGYTVYI